MKVNVAGAGAGKTTKMADYITEFSIPEGKVVFCIAFTNAAVDNIVNKVIAKKGMVPNNIKISTIHSFLYKELIDPFYYFLYGKQFERLSVIDLPNDYIGKSRKLTELENENILHLTKIPEKAKWVAYQKSGDSKIIKDARKSILRHFADYCAAVFVDEAQDINEDIMHILEAFDQEGINIVLYGDPKQDIKGFGCFKQIIEHVEEVHYIKECFRCPKKHLNLSNLLASKEQLQVADKHNANGRVEVVFESDIKDIQQFLSDGNYGLQYISMKRERFETHVKCKESKTFDTLYHEVYRAMIEKWENKKSDIVIKAAAFFVVEQMLEEYEKGCKVSMIISKWVSNNTFNVLTSQRYSQMASGFKAERSIDNKVPVVHSIEIVKGLEAERCLFILTTDLAPYLFGIRTTDNRTRHLLYVALTRSLDHLTILVTKEVEEKYTRLSILSFFALLL